MLSATDAARSQIVQVTQVLDGAAEGEEAAFGAFASEHLGWLAEILPEVTSKLNSEFAAESVGLPKTPSSKRKGRKRVRKVAQPPPVMELDEDEETPATAAAARSTRRSTRASVRASTCLSSVRAAILAPADSPPSKTKGPARAPLSSVANTSGPPPRAPAAGKIRKRAHRAKTAKPNTPKHRSGRKRKSEELEDDADGSTNTDDPAGEPSAPMEGAVAATAAAPAGEVPVIEPAAEEEEEEEEEDPATPMPSEPATRLQHTPEDAPCTSSLIQTETVVKKKRKVSSLRDAGPTTPEGVAPTAAHPSGKGKAAKQQPATPSTTVRANAGSRIQQIVRSMTPATTEKRSKRVVSGLRNGDVAKLKQRFEDHKGARSTASASRPAPPKDTAAPAPPPPAAAAAPAPAEPRAAASKPRRSIRHQKAGNGASPTGAQPAEDSRKRSIDHVEAAVETGAAAATVERKRNKPELTTPVRAPSTTGGSLANSTDEGIDAMITTPPPHESPTVTERRSSPRNAHMKAGSMAKPHSKPRTPSNLKSSVTVLPKPKDRPKAAIPALQKAQTTKEGQQKKEQAKKANQEQRLQAAKLNAAGRVLPKPKGRPAAERAEEARQRRLEKAKRVQENKRREDEKQAEQTAKIREKMRKMEERRKLHAKEKEQKEKLAREKLEHRLKQAEKRRQQEKEQQKKRRELEEKTKQIEAEMARKKAELEDLRTAEEAAMKKRQHEQVKGLGHAPPSSHAAGAASSSHGHHYKASGHHKHHHASSSNYDISDLHSDDSTDEEDEPRKKIPSWAEGQALRAAILGQYASEKDPEVIFPAVSPPNLDKIFPNSKRNKKYQQRGSSALWADSPSRPGGVFRKVY